MNINHTMRKQITALLAVFIFLNLATAASVNGTQQQYNISSGEFTKTAFTFNGSGNFTYQSKDLPEANLLAEEDFFNQKFQEGDKAGFTIFANNDLQPGNYSFTVNFQHTYTIQNGNNTSKRTEPITSDVLLVYEQPFYNIYDSTIDEGETIQFLEDGLQMKLKDVKDNKLTFESSSSIPCLTVEGSCTFERNGEDYKIKITDSFPSKQFAGIQLKSTLDQSVKVDKIEPEGGMAIIENIYSGPIRRGETYSFKTRDNATGDELANVEVKFTGKNYGGIGVVSTNRQGTGSVVIPEDFDQGQVYWEVISKPEGYEGGSGILNIPRSYDSYLERNSLTLANLPEKVEPGDEISGKAVSQTGKVWGDTKIIAELNGGTVQKAVNKETGKFSFQAPQNEDADLNLTIKAVRSDKSDTQFDTQANVRVVGDKDGDGVLNPQDNCDDELGPAENNGCPKQSISIQFYEKQGKGEDSELQEIEREEMKPGPLYFFKMKNEDGETVNQTGELTVVDQQEDNSTNLTFQQGVGTIGFNDGGTHEIKYAGSASIGEMTDTVQIEESNSGIQLWQIGLVALILIVGGIIYLNRKNSGNRSSSVGKGTTDKSGGSMSPSSKKDRKRSSRKGRRQQRKQQQGSRRNR